MTDRAPSPLPLDEWLRAAWDDPAAGCPPPEVWLEDELADLPPAERRRLEAHAASCPACAAERELAATFDAGNVGAGAPGVRREDVAAVVARLEAASPVKGVRPKPSNVVAFPARRTFSRQFAQLAAAAMVVLATGLGYQLTRPGPPALPAPQAGGVVRGGEVEALSPLGEVAEVPGELRWTPRPGAASYRVRLSTVDDAVLWEASVPAPPARIPAEVVRALHPAVSYVWTVEALDAAGRRLGASEPARFRARPLPEGTTEPRTSSLHPGKGQAVEEAPGA